MGGPTTISKETRFIGKQAMFFVSTAALSQDHHVNCSPKSMEEFRIIDNDTLAYIDLTGCKFIL